MHAQVDLAREKGVLDLLGEEPLAADFREGAVGDAVAAGLDHPDGDGGGVEAVGPGDQVAHQVGLGESQGRAAGADAQDGEDFRLQTRAVLL